MCYFVFLSDESLLLCHNLTVSHNVNNDVLTEAVSCNRCNIMVFAQEIMGFAKSSLIALGFFLFLLIVQCHFTHTPLGPCKLLRLLIDCIS